MIKTLIPTLSQSEFETYQAKQQYRWGEILRKEHKLVPVEVIFIPEHAAYYARYIETPNELHLLQSDSLGHPCIDWDDMVKQLGTTICEGGLINRFVSMKMLIKNVEQDYMNRSNNPYCMNLFLDKLNRENFIQVSRLVKEQVTKDVWTSEVALAFGAVLKELNQ